MGYIPYPEIDYWIAGLEYVVMVSADGYLNGKELVNTLKLNVSRNFKSMIGLNPIEKPIELPNIFYDFGSWTLRDKSKTALDDFADNLFALPT